MNAFDIRSLLSDSTAESLQRISSEFLSAVPFKFVVIDNFLRQDLAEGLWADFPRFDEKNAMNEVGLVGGMATFTKVRQLSPHYRLMDEGLSSREMLRTIGGITGIDDLIFDPKYFGGGTHDNKHGQELDPHVDFNYQENSPNHRRLNLIVYLNKEWKREWGGQIEVHSNPRDPATNVIKGFNPEFNRCIIFETNEVSWHGFSKINLPSDRRDLSRKSFAIYYYTRSRPDQENFPPHGTFYVPRPLPESLLATMAPETAQAVRSALQRRNEWINFYHRKELEWRGESERLMAALHNPLIAGPAFILGRSRGHHHDHWLEADFLARLRSTAPIRQIRIGLFFPSGRAQVHPMTLRCKEKTLVIGEPRPDICMDDLGIDADEDFDLGISFSSGSRGNAQDTRVLSAILSSIAFS